MAAPFRLVALLRAKASYWNASCATVKLRSVSPPE
jgi:hypothetical protein